MKQGLMTQYLDSHLSQSNYVWIEISSPKRGARPKRAELWAIQITSPLSPKCIKSWPKRKEELQPQILKNTHQVKIGSLYKVRHDISEHKLRTSRKRALVQRKFKKYVGLNPERKALSQICTRRWQPNRQRAKDETHWMKMSPSNKVHYKKKWQQGNRQLNIIQPTTDGLLTRMRGSRQLSNRKQKIG